MKKVLKVLACSLVISMLFSCAVFAKPVHTNLLHDGYTDDTALNFARTINEGIQKENMNLPYISNLQLIDDGSVGTRAYLGSWGNTTIVIKEDALTNKFNYISVSLPSAFYTKEPTIEGWNFFSEMGLISGFINNSNDINKAKIDDANNSFFNSKKSCSCSAGKLHYEWVFNDNIMMMNISAIVDDGTK